MIFEIINRLQYKINNSKLLFFSILSIFALVYFIIVYYNSYYDLLKTNKIDLNELVEETELRCSEYSEYKQKCIGLYENLLHPDPGLFFNPPLAHPPKELLNAFTQNGEMPIMNYNYFNEIYADANKEKSENIVKIPKSEVDQFRLINGERQKPLGTFGYGDKTNIKLMNKYSNQIKGKTMTVIGTLSPWLEAISLDAGARKVFTLEYTRKFYEQHDLLEWLHVNDYLDYSIRSNQIQHFDNAASYSSIEHSGLGRFGDPLDPDGDIKASQQIHCMLKPGGLFFLGVPVSTDNSSFIVFNAHRVYGHKRLTKLFEIGWELVERAKSTDEQDIFVLRKKQIIC